jgi:hypothetical protein
MKIKRRMIGKRFGRWIIDSLHNLAPGKKWNCICDCGTEKSVYEYSLKNGSSQSCGCLTRDRSIETHSTHNGTYKPEYRVWAAMKSRCSNPKDLSFHNYGGRGIKVCESWLSFENFYTDMGPCPKGLELDRINNDGNYEPGNCEWVTKSANDRNRRNTLMLTLNGVTKAMKTWSEEYGIPHHTVRYRIKRGWEPNLALTIKVGEKYEA